MVEVGVGVKRIHDTCTITVYLYLCKWTLEGECMISSPYIVGAGVGWSWTLDGGKRGGK